IPCFCENPLATKRALNRSISPAWFSFTRNTHRLPIALQPIRFLRFARSGFLPVQTSCGDLSWLMACVGHQFRRNVAVITASPQYPLGNPACSNLQRVYATNARFIRSATPFSCGVNGGANFCTMPRSAQNLAMAFDLYSPPLSLVKVDQYLFWNSSETGERPTLTRSKRISKGYISVYLYNSPYCCIISLGRSSS
ncbi:hypothetical protein PHMEG_00028699, partial [Phytophthora megakarya]